MLTWHRSNCMHCPTSFWDAHYYSHFTDEETEAQEVKRLTHIPLVNVGYLQRVGHCLQHLSCVYSLIPSKVVKNRHCPLFAGQVQRGSGLASNPWQGMAGWTWTPAVWLPPVCFPVALPWCEPLTAVLSPCTGPSVATTLRYLPPYQTQKG